MGNSTVTLTCFPERKNEGEAIFEVKNGEEISRNEGKHNSSDLKITLSSSRKSFKLASWVLLLEILIHQIFVIINICDLQYFMAHL